MIVKFDELVVRCSGAASPLNLSNPALYRVGVYFVYAAVVAFSRVRARAMEKQPSVFVCVRACIRMRAREKARGGGGAERHTIWCSTVLGARCVFVVTRCQHYIKGV